MDQTHTAYEHRVRLKIKVTRNNTAITQGRGGDDEETSEFGGPARDSFQSEYQAKYKADFYHLNEPKEFPQWDFRWRAFVLSSKFKNTSSSQAKTGNVTHQENLHMSNLLRGVTGRLWPLSPPITTTSAVNKTTHTNRSPAHLKRQLVDTAVVFQGVSCGPVGVKRVIHLISCCPWLFITQQDRGGSRFSELSLIFPALVFINTGLRMESLFPTQWPQMTFSSSVWSFIQLTFSFCFLLDPQKNARLHKNYVKRSQLRVTKSSLRQLIIDPNTNCTTNINSVLFKVRLVLLCDTFSLLPSSLFSLSSFFLFSLLTWYKLFFPTFLISFLSFPSFLLAPSLVFPLFPFSLTECSSHFSPHRPLLSPSFSWIEPPVCNFTAKRRLRFSCRHLCWRPDRRWTHQK